MSLRSFVSSADPETLRNIQKGTMRYSWRGVHCCKNPFDLALYAMLLHELKPRTIIEIGTKDGGSALWLRDISRACGLDAQIVSVDIDTDRRQLDSAEAITFLQGDGPNLAPALDPVLTDLPRPWMVIEDASHDYECTKGVLDYFGSKMEAGEYIVVKDGICDTWGNNWKYNGGPNRAVREFLEADPPFEVDTRYCDFFGQNGTWNPNGYLKRV